MKKNLVFAGLLFVTGVSQMTAQEKEGNIPEVTIAAKSNQQLHKTGKNVQLITTKDLEKYKGQNLSEVLSQVSGFQITGNFNNNTEPKSLKIRGGKMANVLVLVDGIPLKDVTGNDYNAVDLRLFAAENIESIEILNGVSSVLYGSNATVSVINIKTKKNSQNNIEGRIGARIGSFGTFSQNALVNGKIKKFNYQITGSNEKSDGISSAEGPDSFDKDGYEKQNITTQFGVQLGKLNLNFNGGYQHHLYDFDNGAFSDGTYRGNDKQLFGGINAQFQYEKGNLVFNSRINGNDRLVQNLAGNSYQDQYSYKGRNIFTELYNQYKISENINVVGGLQYEVQNLGSENLPWGGTALEDVLNFDNTRVSTFDAFINTNLQLSDFHLDLGGRLNNHSKYNSHFVYSINPYYLKNLEQFYYKIGFSYATAFIAPTLYQTYGSLPYTLANFDLKPETNSSYEIDFSIGKPDQSFVINASAFLREERDVFAYQIVDFTTYAGKFLNVDRNNVRGLELGLKYKINEIVNFGGNFSFAEKSNVATRLRAPKQRANAFVEVLPFKNSRINIAYQYVSKRDDAYYDSSTFGTKKVVLDAFNLFNVNINQKFGKNVEAFVNVSNLFNTSYVDVIGFKTKPRAFTLGIDYKF